MTERHGDRPDTPVEEPVWVVRTGSNSMKHNRDSADVVPYERDLTEPAPTVDTKAGNAWALTRPATTIVGSFCPDVVAAPGYRTTTSRQNAEGSIKITEQDALILQSFPPDYPLQGSRSKRFEQVGNAVPPRVAAFVVASLTGRAIDAEEGHDERRTA